MNKKQAIADAGSRVGAVHVVSSTRHARQYAFSSNIDGRGWYTRQGVAYHQAVEQRASLVTLLALENLGFSRDEAEHAVHMTSHAGSVRQRVAFAMGA